MPLTLPRRLRPFSLLAALALGACSSNPTHYYTLVAPMAEPAAATAPAAFQLELLPVSLPVQVDQPPLVIRQSDGTLGILETERWGAPLSDEFHDALRAGLEQQLGLRDLAGLPKQPGVPVVAVRADVRRFESALNSHVLVDVVWSLSSRNSAEKRQTLTCDSIIRLPVGAGIESLVLGHQQALTQLSQRIARTARQWDGQAVGGCQG